MSNISQQRLIEMEAEMDRFEQEILAQDSDDLPKVIIGSSTYNQVAAQLKMLRAATEHHKELREEPQNDDSDDEHDYDADRSRMLDRNEPPPKKPALDVPLLPPPPPPPPAMTSTPSFVPHQIRHRQPAGARPGMHGPPRMRPPPPPPRPYGGGPPMGPGPGPGPGGMSGHPGPGQGPMPGRFMGPRPGLGPMGPYGPGPGPHRGPAPPSMGPGMGPGPGPGMGMSRPRPMGGPPDHMSSGMYGVSSGEQHASLNEEKQQEPDEDKPKVIYASAPVINVQKEPKKKKKKKKKAEQIEGEGTDNSSDKAKSSSDVSSETSAVVAGPVMAPVEMEQDDLHVADMEIDNPYLTKKEKKEKKKKFVRMAAGTTWEDASLGEWGNDDFRLFCGDLGNEVTDEVLARAFSKYPSFIRSKVIRDKRTNKTKGYGFVSFKDPNDYVRAMREMNGKYVGNRPIKLRKSTWKERNIDSVKKKEREKKRLGLR